MKGIINRIALVVFGVLAASLLLLGVFNEKGLLKVRAQSQRLETIEAEATTIEAQNKALTEEIHALRTDPAMIEKIAREELKLVKPHEVVLVNPPAQDKN